MSIKTLLLSLFFLSLSWFFPLNLTYAYDVCGDGSGGVSENCCGEWITTCTQTTQNCTIVLGVYVCANICVSSQTSCSYYTSCPSSCGGGSSGGGGNSTPSFCTGVAPFCGGGENCSNCPSECGACPTSAPPPPPPPPPSGSDPSDWTPPGNSGGFCQGGGCSGSETCANCPGDCGACSCGNGVCGAGESCSNCAIDCGACASPAYCGDGIANGFETCVTCPGDVGACNNAWWQTRGGHVFAYQTSGAALRSNVPNSGCTAPTCIAYLNANDLADTLDTFGYALTGGGGLTTNNKTNLTNIRSIGTANTRYRENYDFFVREFDLGLSPSEDFTGIAGDAPKPTVPPLNSKKAYFHQGDLTIQQTWDVASNEKIVVFVNGNLTFTDPSNIQELTRVANGGFLAFIVSGNITIDENVGNNTSSSLTPNLEGVFIANGTITTESTSDITTEQRFVGEGSFIGHTNVSLDRDLNIVDNQTIPAETFIFRPDFVTNLPDEMKRPQYIWQETN